MQLLTRLTASPQTLDALNASLAEVDDWAAFLRQAELYGVSNQLLRQVRSNELAIPQEAVLSLKALALRHRSAADARYQVIEKLSLVLQQRNIPVVALKGLALAPMIYSADELRPMRDMDVLVPREREAEVATIVRELGFELPETQPTRYMRDTHQLPNATKQVNGFTISLEVHHDALSRDAPGSFFYEEVAPELQAFRWRELELLTLGHEHMLHQLCRHLEALHPGGVLKLINVMDVVLYSEQYIEQIDWQRVKANYSHVLNTLKCLHQIMPLSGPLQARVGGVSTTQNANVGEIMLPLTIIFHKQNSLKKKLNLLFAPSDWWLHLYYNVNPTKSLLLVKLVKHPVTIISWLAKRLYSRLLGG
ncbi:MAG: nucleotidyltransferase family protein [Pseudomonadota bacterium]